MHRVVILRVSVGRVWPRPAPTPPPLSHGQAHYSVIADVHGLHLAPYPTVMWHSRVPDPCAPAVSHTQTAVRPTPVTTNATLPCQVKPDDVVPRRPQRLTGHGLVPDANAYRSILSRRVVQTCDCVAMMWRSWSCSTACARLAGCLDLKRRGPSVAQYIMSGNPSRRAQVARHVFQRGQEGG